MGLPWSISSVDSLTHNYLRVSWLIQARSVHSPLARRLPSRVLLLLGVLIFALLGDKGHYTSVPQGSPGLLLGKKA